jgi:hypothetical protein
MAMNALELLCRHVRASGPVTAGSIRNYIREQMGGVDTIADANHVTARALRQAVKFRLIEKYDLADWPRTYDARQMCDE